MPGRASQFRFFAQTEKRPSTEAESLLNLCREDLGKEQAVAAITSCQKAVNAYQKLGDYLGEAKSIINLGIAYKNLYQYEKAIIKLNTGLSISQQLKKNLLIAITSQNLSQIYAEIGQEQSAKTLQNQANTIFTKLDIADQLARQGADELNLNQLDAALNSFQEALNIYQNMGDDDSGIITRSKICAVYASKNDLEEALVHCQIALRKIKLINKPKRESKISNLLGTIYRRQADYIRAEEYHRKALYLAESINDFRLQVDALISLAFLYNSQKDHEKVITLTEKSLSLSREIEALPEQVVALNFLGSSYLAIDKYQEAIKVAKASLAIAREINDFQRQSFALSILGIAYSSIGENLKSNKFYLEKLEIERSIGQKQGEIITLINLSANYNVIGEYQKSIEFTEQALALAQKYNDPLLIMDAFKLLILVYKELNDFNRAIYYTNKQLEIAESIRESNPLIEVEILIELSKIYRLQGNTKKADQILRKATLLQEKIQSSESLYKGKKYENSKILNKNFDKDNNYFQLYQDSHLKHFRGIDFHQANIIQENKNFIKEITQKEWIQIPSTNIQKQKALILLDLCQAYLEAGNLEKSIQLAQQVLKISEQVSDKQLKANALKQISQAYIRLGYFEKVLEVEEERWAIEQKNNRLGLQILALLDLSQAYIKVGQLEKAIKHAYHAISLNQGQYPGLDFLAYGQLAEYYHDLNKSVMAIIHYKQAINSLEYIRSKNLDLTQELQSSYLRDVGNKVGKAEIYRRLSSLLLDQNRVMEALLTLDLLKVNELQDFYKEEVSNQDKAQCDIHNNNNLAQCIQFFPQERELLKLLVTTMANSDHNLQNYQVTKLKALEQRILIIAPEQNLQLAAYSDLKSRLSNLGQNSALLYPLVLTDRLELVLFTRNSPPIHKTIPIPKQELETAVVSFRNEIKNTKTNAIQKPAQKLYQWLIKPIAAELEQNKIQTLIYAPDGQMRYVPLAALYDGKQWLVEKYQINYITALSLTELEKESFQNPNILAGAFT